MRKTNFQELTSLFFEMRQVIRANLPQGHADPNAWLRSETLRFIGEEGEPTMLELAKHLRVTAPSATSLVRKLESLGWIERRRSGSDKRVVRIRLTASGRREVRRYRARTQRVMKKVFSKLPARDLEHLRTALGTLRDVHRI